MKRRRIGSILAGFFALGFSFMFSCAVRHEPTVYVTANVSPSEREAMASVLILSSDGTHQPTCGAVSIYNGNGLAVLATAAHCVRHKVDPFDPAPNAEREARVGDTILYVTKGLTAITPRISNRATIIQLDEPRDKAFLFPVQNEAPHPLETSQLCDRCTIQPTSVHAIAPVYGWSRHDGTVIGRTYAGGSSWYYEATLSINFGWSGSPVLNEDGKVIGLIVQCHKEDVLVDDHMIQVCQPGWSIFTSIQ